MFTHALVNRRGIIVKKFHSLTEATNAALIPPLYSKPSSYGYTVSYTHLTLPTIPLV